jgi:hypothetical protein
VVECGGLENRYGPFWSIEGSNPSPSAFAKVSNPHRNLPHRKVGYKAPKQRNQGARLKRATALLVYEAL